MSHFDRLLKPRGHWDPGRNGYLLSLIFLAIVLALASL
jgi:hypothetical protein